jgi:hypothetical protein
VNIEEDKNNFDSKGDGEDKEEEEEEKEELKQQET